jgi:hypothetical protein
MSALPPTAVASDQWLRRVSLIVSDSSGNGLDLSNLRIKFHVEQADLSAMRPKTAVITVYNLADSTVASIKEFTEVTLQAGYQPPGKFGIIFQGTIKEFERGHESVTESYLKIFAADGDLARYAVTNTTLAPGYTTEDEYEAHLKALEAQGIKRGYNGIKGTGGLPVPAYRGKILLGMTPAMIDNLGKTNGFTWVIVNGAVQSVPLTGYLPGEAVQLNAQSGLVGWPTNTSAGVLVMCLLNPAIQIQGLIQINNKDINIAAPAKGAELQNFPNAVVGFPGPHELSFFASIADDGFYRVLVIEHVGDTRGNPWYTQLTCLAADLSAPAGQQVPISNPVAPSTSLP